MTFDFTPEQLTLRDEARAFARVHVAPAAVAIDEAGDVPAELLREAAALLARAAAPIEAAVVVEELAVASASVAAAAAIGAGREAFPGLRGAGAVQHGALDARVRLLVSAVALGVGRSALESAIEVCREAGERPGGSASERPHWVLADSATEVDAARLLVWRGAQALEERQSAEAEIALAQTLAIGASDRAVAGALRVSGADGYKKGALLERLARDARTLAFVAGTEDEQRLAAASRLPA